jgi:hypothetical protein
MSQNKYYFRFGMTENWLETLLFIIGASASMTATDVQGHANENSIYVSWAGEDGSGADGTQEYPFRTIQYALDYLDETHTIITILDSNYYYTGDGSSLYLDISGFTLQGAEGQKPILILDTLLASQERMVRLSSAGTLINVEIQVPESYLTQCLGIEAYDGTLKNVTILNANKNAISKLTSGTLAMDNCYLTGSRNEGSVDGSGISIAEGVINAAHCLLADNDYCGIIATGAAAKEVNLNYCTISNNQYGVNVAGCSNLELNISNSINYRNRIYDHYGDIATYSHTCVGKIQGAPTLTPSTNNIRVNPLFVSNSDYRIRTKYNGYANVVMQSPCLGMSDTYYDLGCYQYTRSLSGQTYTEIELPAPDKITKTKSAVDSKLITTILLTTKLLKRGIKNRLDISWSGSDNVLTEDQFNLVQLMFMSEINDVFLSVDNKLTFIKYLFDKTKESVGSRSLNVNENTYHQDINISLIEV